LIGTGSELQLVVEAQELLVKEGIKARVVSMPSWELFEKQSKAYKDSVLPPSYLYDRLAVEGRELLWLDKLRYYRRRCNRH
jgi:transketolase